MISSGKIVIYSNYFTVLPISPVLRVALRQYLEDYIQVTLEKKRGRFRPVKKRIYARRSLRNGTVALHRNTYYDFISFLKDNFIDISSLEIVRKPMYEPLHFDLDPGDYSPRGEQPELIDYVLTDGHQKCITLQAGQGKAQTLNSLLKTPKGWLRMGDVKVGDEIVAWNGDITTVTGVYPQGVTKVYRVHFSDRRHVDVSGEHLWQIRIQLNEKERVVTTEDIIKILEKNNSRPKRVTVPLYQPDVGIEQDVLIDPYVLGVILGDGNITDGNLVVTKNSEAVMARLESRLVSFCKLNRIKSDELLTYSIVRNTTHKSNYIKESLRDYGLDNCLSYDKFIPEVYLNGSYDQRLELIRGLMDTDGTIGKSGEISFSSSSKSLATSVQYLIRSLGGIAKLSSKTPFYTYKGEKKEGRISYRVHIRHPNPELLFTHPEKHERALIPNQYSKNLRLRIESITERFPEPTQCISIAHPSKLYVTNDFIVTHNTMISIFVACLIKTRMLVITQGGYSERWEVELRKVLDLQGMEFVSLCGFKPLLKFLMRTAKGETSDAKCIFLSVTGMRDYIKHYESGKLKEYRNIPDVPPEDLCEYLGIGLKVVDEVHKDFHANFIADLYTHVPKTLYLTATLFSKESFLARMYETMLPPSMRREASKLEVYVEAIQVQYYLENPEAARFMGGMGTYSHTTFEQWIMKDEHRLKNFLSALFNYITRVWLLDKLEDERILIWAATVEMVEHIVLYFRKRAPDLITNAFTAGDPYYLVDEADVIASTLGRSGTALDIEDLTQVHMTTNIMSWNANIQALGRLRQLKNPKLKDVKCKFFYYICMDIEKHLEYAADKKGLIKNRVTRIIEDWLGKRI